MFIFIYVCEVQRGICFNCVSKRWENIGNFVSPEKAESKRVMIIHNKKAERGKESLILCFKMMI